MKIDTDELVIGIVVVSSLIVAIWLSVLNIKLFIEFLMGRREPYEVTGIAFLCVMALCWVGYCMPTIDYYIEEIQRKFRNKGW